MVNDQLIEKQVETNSPAINLDVISIWKTIQGEGPFAGRPAVFIRLAGCNLQCQLCDTDYTHNRRMMLTEDIVGKVKELFCHDGRATRRPPLVVITGGEPFRQNISRLINALSLEDFLVQIETNGTLFPRDAMFVPWHFVTVVCSPKTPMIDEKLLPYISAWKYVVNADEVSENTGLPLRTLGGSTSVYIAKDIIDGPRDVYIQPLDEFGTGKNEANLAAAVASVMKFGYTLCLQVHKIANLK